MKNFFCILLICTKIIEIICTGDAGPSQRDKKGKRKLDEYLEQNPSNSNESTDDLISNPYADWLQEGMLLPIGNDQLVNKSLASTNDKNDQHSMWAQQNSIAMNKQQMEQNPMENIQKIKVGKNVKVINTNRENFKDLVEKYTGAEMHTAADENPMKCKWCGKIFVDESSRKLHELEHQSENSHNCPKCGASFIQKYELTRHMTKKVRPCIEKGSTPFQCTICGKNFQQEKYLKKHQNYTKCHTKENILTMTSRKGPMN